MPYRSIEDPVKLRRLLEATLLLEADLDLSELLRHVIKEACAMTGARYGALGVLNEDRTALVEFLTVGLSTEEEALIGARPTGKGILGLLISDPKPIRIPDIATHATSSGFPPNHPPMVSFLGVPIRVRDEVYGNLYLTDKVGWSEFTADDESLACALALAAGIGIENARLQAQSRRVAVYEDRDRLARDLHDTVIQRLFAIGLSLQALAGSASVAGIANPLFEAISGIDDTIREVRSAIFELTSSEGRGVRAATLALVRELAPVIRLDPAVKFEGPIDTAVSTVLAEHLLATLREALTNVGRHADASAVRVEMSVAGGRCRLRVADDGKGMGEPVDPRPAGGGGLGLGNLRRRADKLGGELLVEPNPGGGTVLTLDVPVGA